MKSFVTNCKHIRFTETNRQYSNEFTAFTDFSVEDVQSLQNTSQLFSGIKTIHEEVEVFGQSKTIGLNPRQFCDNQFGFFNNYTRSNKCSTSWVTSAIHVAERTIQQKSIVVQLSAEYLFRCLSRDDDEEADPCRAYSNKDTFEFIDSNGLISEEDAAILGDDICRPDGIENITIYRFTVIHSAVPNQGSLMNMVYNETMPSVMLALNLSRLRFVKDATGDGVVYTGPAKHPSVFAVVTGYEQWKGNGTDGFWLLESNVNPCETIRFKVSMRNNTGNADYAGIAGYAVSLAMAFDQIVTTRHMTVSATSVINQLDAASIETLTIVESRVAVEVNPGDDSLELGDTFTNVIEVILKDRSLSGVSNVSLTGIERLTSIVVGDGVASGSLDPIPDGRIRLSDVNSASITIRDNKVLVSIIIGYDSFRFYMRIELSNLLSLREIRIGDGNLYSCTELVLECG